jgi:nucleoside-diphosphate-sugar epimerase
MWEWKGRVALVTGGSSFIAASLVRRLLKLGVQVHVMLRPGSPAWRLQGCSDRLQLHHGDMTQREGLLELIGGVAPDAVFHLATAKGASASYLDYVETAVLGAAHLLESMARAERPPRLIVAGSSMEYASAAGAVGENAPLRPHTVNGAVKAAAGLLYGQAAGAHGLWIKQLRLYHVYGPWESPHRFLPTAIRLAQLGQPIPLAAGESRRDWIYVDDVVEAMLLAATVDTPEGVFNVGAGVEYSNREVLATLADALDRELTWREGALPPRHTDSAHRLADIRLAREVLGWSPRFSLRRGIAATIDWLRANPDVGPGIGEAPPTAV